MRRLLRLLRPALCLPAFALLACGASSSGSSDKDGGASDTGPGGPDGKAPKDAPSGGEGSPGDGATCTPPEGGAPAVATTASNIKHVVIIVQENHTFDNYFNYYCTAALGSAPTCNTGPACCETGPAMDKASGDAPTTQDDKQNGGYDPIHTQVCELTEIDDGKMDDYVTSASCGAAGNFAYANEATVMPYWTLAGTGAIADTYWQSAVGASSMNDMYLATASYVFLDDTVEPDAIGSACAFSPTKSFTNMTIGDLLATASVPWTWFGQGYAAMVAAQKMGKCPTDPMCPYPLGVYPCIFDPGDNPFDYFKQFADNPKYLQDYDQFTCDLTTSALPSVVYLKAIGYRSEHPGFGDTISAGEGFVNDTLRAIEASPYKSDTLVLLTWDESGGFYDHMKPPQESAIDHQPYGPRIPFFALGTFAKKNYISHVPMEHSSIVKFVEWNWLGKTTGQLGQRDTVVNNIGDMLDPAQTGVAVPAN